MSHVDPERRILPRIAYACGTFGHDVFYAMLATYFMIFVTSNLFHSGNATKDQYMIGIVTTIILVLRIAELFVDPFIGNLIDKTDMRWGRFKPWVITGAFVAAILYRAKVKLTEAEHARIVEELERNWDKMSK